MGGFRKKFWDEKVEWAKAGDVLPTGEPVARIEGRHYIIGPKGAPSYMKGFDGRPFAIRFTGGPHAGKVIHTDNLWYQGEIPEEYRSLLPDNAEFAWEELNLYATASSEKAD